MCFSLDFEIYLYDRAGHGFSSHLPVGSDYSYAYNLRDLRSITQCKFNKIDNDIRMFLILIVVKLLDGLKIHIRSSVTVMVLILPWQYAMYHVKMSIVSLFC
jgi:hypothetical protein